jgi:hypothetical protein
MYFFFNFIKTLDPDSPEMQDPDTYPDPDSMNPPDLQHWCPKMFFLFRIVADAS